MKSGLTPKTIEAIELLHSVYDTTLALVVSGVNPLFLEHLQTSYSPYKNLEYY